MICACYKIITVIWDYIGYHGNASDVIRYTNYKYKVHVGLDSQLARSRVSMSVSVLKSQVVV